MAHKPHDVNIVGMQQLKSPNMVQAILDNSENITAITVEYHQVEAFVEMVAQKCDANELLGSTHAIQQFLQYTHGSKPCPKLRHLGLHGYTVDTSDDGELAMGLDISYTTCDF